MRESAPPLTVDDLCIPRVTCPQCGGQMGLSRIEPEGRGNKDHMFFACVCGFEYRLSDMANKALKR